MVSTISIPCPIHRILLMLFAKVDMIAFLSKFQLFFRVLEILELMLKKEFNDRVAVSLIYKFLEIVLSQRSSNIIQISFLFETKFNSPKCLFYLIFQEFISKFKHVQTKELQVKKHHSLGVLMRENCEEEMRWIFNFSSTFEICQKWNC